MKKLFSLIACFVLMFMSLTGCALFDRPELNPDYSNFTATAIALAEKQPYTVKIDLPGGGSIKWLDPRDRIRVEQKNPHPGYRLAGQIITTAGKVAGIYFVVEGVQAIVKTIATNSGDRYSHSFNDIEGDNVHTGHVGNGSQVGDSNYIYDSFNDDHSVNMPPEEVPLELPPDEPGITWF